MKKAISLLLVTVGLFAAGTAAAQTQTAAATSQPGHRLIAMCIGCHNIPGYQATFPEVHKVPMIAGQSAGYIVSALTAYKKGDRKHPTMRGIAGSLSDQDMKDIAAYYEQLGKSGEAAALPADKLAVEPSAAVAELLKKGNCVSCHGANLSKPIDPSYPKLAGQYNDYLYVALKAYQTETNPHVGRSNPIMSAQAKPFTHEQLKELADYIGSLPSELKTVPQSRFR
jgi:cytochrome c553